MAMSKAVLSLRKETQLRGRGECVVQRAVWTSPQRDCESAEPQWPWTSLVLYKCCVISVNTETMWSQ